MKEVTHGEWIKNPTPRMMWCWDNCEETKKQRKVIYVSKDPAYLCPVMTVVKECNYICYQHCAEIEKPRRMTNKELAHWLREKPTRECKWTFDGCVCSVHTYNEKCENEEVHKDVVIREDDGDWREPLVEVKE